MTYLRLPRHIAAAALAAALVTPAMAQTANTPPPSAEAPNVTDQQLERYASVAVEVDKINRAYQPKLSNAPTREDQEALYEEAANEMTQAIRNEGLSVEQYNQLTRSVQSNPELAEQVQAHINEKR